MYVQFVFIIKVTIKWLKNHKIYQPSVYVKITKPLEISTKKYRGTNHSTSHQNERKEYFDILDITLLAFPIHYSFGRQYCVLTNRGWNKVSGVTIAGDADGAGRCGSV